LAPGARQRWCQAQTPFAILPLHLLLGRRGLGRNLPPIRRPRCSIPPTQLPEFLRLEIQKPRVAVWPATGAFVGRDGGARNLEGLSARTDNSNICLERRASLLFSRCLPISCVFRECMHLAPTPLVVFWTALLLCRGAATPPSSPPAGSSRAAQERLSCPTLPHACDHHGGRSGRQPLVPLQL
jgi:hypothetical protein